MDVWMVFIVAVISYLLGSISFTRIVSHIVDRETDITQVTTPASSSSASGHQLNSVSATTASIKLGTRVGCLIGFLDMLKAFLPALLARLLVGPYYGLIAAIASMAGHNWPIYYRFKGGRGMSTYLGGLLAIDPLGAVVTNVLGLFLGMIILRDVVVAYLSGIVFLIPWMAIFSGDIWFVLYALAINVLFTVSMIPDIKQIIAARRSPEYKKAGSDERMTNALEFMPMGRGMLRMMTFFGRAPRKAQHETSEPKQPVP